MAFMAITTGLNYRTASTWESGIRVVVNKGTCNRLKKYESERQREQLDNFLFSLMYVKCLFPLYFDSF